MTDYDPRTATGIPTEPVGSLPRPSRLQQAYARYDAGEITREQLETEQDTAVRDSIEHQEQTGTPIISDGEQRWSSFATYAITDTLAGTGLADNLAGDGGQFFAIFADGHNRQLPRLTGGPFRYKTYAADTLAKSLPMAHTPMKQAVIAPSMLALLYPLDSEIPGYSREAFEEDLVNECEKDIRQAFAAGAARVSVDFTEGRLATRADPRNPWTGRGMLPHFIELNNRVMARFSAEERSRIGLHTCPGGDRDSVHSADVPYSDLLPSMFGINAGYFLIQLASERDKDRVYQLIGERGPDGLHRGDQPAEPAGGEPGRGQGCLGAGGQLHPEGAARRDRRLRVLAVQHRREAQPRLARLRPRDRLAEDHQPGRGDEASRRETRRRLTLVRIGGHRARARAVSSRAL
jgi:methionine synthase II (cobalamin-independent)